MSHVDVVIVNYRSAAHTAACVGAAHKVARADGVTLNIVVVNNSDDASALEALVVQRGPATFIHNDANLGFGAACNIGAAGGKAPFILFLNPDAMLKEGYFKTALSFMTDPGNAGIGILGPAIEREDGALSATCSPLPSIAGLLTRTLGLSDGFLPASAHARSGVVGQVMGAVLLIRRALFEDLAGFDPRFFLYYEDVDLCARAAARGAASYYLTTAHAVHIGRVSSSQDTGMALALFLRSRFTYARLHFGAPAQGLLIVASFLAELPLRLLRTLLGGKSITGIAVLRAYRLLTINLVSGASLVGLGAGKGYPMTGSVLALTRYGRLGGSSRVRVMQYIPHLESQGLHVDVQALFSDEDLRRLYKDGRRSKSGLISALAARVSAVRHSRSGDVIWLQQELFPYLPFVLEAALLAGRRLVLDFDDAQHLYYKGRPFFGDKIEKLMRRADAVTVGSPFMGDYVRDAGGKNVHLVYSAVDTAAFAPSPPPETFTVGWIGTPMTANQSLHILREPLARFLRETNSKAIFIGMDEGQFPDLPGERIPWSEAAEHEALPRLSVGLCPLEDNAWTRGKSGYKIIQYMAAGKPALTSPVGIAADIVEDGTTGFHCRAAEDWYHRLLQLHGDRHLLTVQGQESRSRAKSRYDTTIAAAQIFRILKDCLRD